MIECPMPIVMTSQHFTSLNEDCNKMILGGATVARHYNLKFCLTVSQ